MNVRVAAAPVRVKVMMMTTFTEMLFQVCVAQNATKQAKNAAQIIGHYRQNTQKDFRYKEGNYQ